MIVDTLGGICRSMERSGDQTWGQLLSNVIDYITITFAIFMITLHYDYINFQM